MREGGRSTTSNNDCDARAVWASANEKEKKAEAGLLCLLLHLLLCLLCH